MEKTNTKEQILEAAMDLFSVKGFEATSISQIADAVGIRKASLYSHFASKQDILDTLVQEVLVQYNQHSIFAEANWEDPEFTKNLEARSPEELARMVQGQIRFILHDPSVSRGRKMLVIEQFQNPELAKLQTIQNYSGIMSYYMGMFRFLIGKGVLKAEDPEIMAVQFSAPVTTWLNLCDREPDKEEEVMDLIQRHVLQFFKVYKQ